MNDNPYHSPPEKEAEREPYDPGPPPTREARLVVVGVLLFAAMIVARFWGPTTCFPYLLAQFQSFC